MVTAFPCADEVVSDGCLTLPSTRVSLWFPSFLSRAAVDLDGFLHTQVSETCSVSTQSMTEYQLCVKLQVFTLCGSFG